MVGNFEILVGDCRAVLDTLPEKHFHCCVTSPPYWGLRDYGHQDQIGSERTPDEFVANMLEVFGKVWRVLRDDGVLWLNLGDTWNAYNGGAGPSSSLSRVAQTEQRPHLESGFGLRCRGLKPKDMVGIPWRVALALQADGWYLRDAVIWHKPAPMPGSQRDRCTNAYEFVFQLTKERSYFFDMEAVKVPTIGDRGGTRAYYASANGQRAMSMGRQASGNEVNPDALVPTASIPRNVWKIAHEGYAGSHFATMPQELASRCIKATTSEYGCCVACGAPWRRIVSSDRVATRPGKDTKVDGHNGATTGNRDPRRHTTVTSTAGWEPGCQCSADRGPCRVLDPFGGAGTTALAARLLGQDSVIIELNDQYAEQARQRITKQKSTIKQPASAPGQKQLFAEEPDL